MRRPRKPVPLAIKGLTYNVTDDLYEIKENGITYKMPLELTRSLKEYFKSTAVRSTFQNVESWYNSLLKDQKRQVIREGQITDSSDGFYPDPVFE